MKLGTELFTAYLQRRNIMDKNIKRYLLQVEDFAHWLNLNTGQDIQNTEKKHVLSYLEHLQEVRKLSTSTRAHTLGVLRHYFTFLYQAGQTATNPTLLIKLRGTKKKQLKKVLSLTERNELLDLHYQTNVRGIRETATKGVFTHLKHVQQRNHLILSLFLYQGLKRSEIERLTLDDIDLQKATIHIQAQHQTNARTLALEAVQIGIFYEYLYQAREQFQDQSNRLINSKPDFHLMTNNLRKLYPSFTDFGQLRSSIITYWIQTEGLRKAQYNAGHRYISSTENYTANDIESLKNDINRFHPL